MGIDNLKAHKLLGTSTQMSFVTLRYLWEPQEDVKARIDTGHFHLVA